jgi:ABC-type glycerol-3-phosphate transport system permease component
MAVSQATTGARAFRGRRRPLRVFDSTIYLVIVVISLTALVPIGWMLTTALKSKASLYAYPPQFFPHEFHWENFVDGARAIDFVHLFFNSCIITGLSVIGAVASSSIVGYGLSRVRFPGRKPLFYAFVGSMMLPPIVGLFPLFYLYNNIGWYNTWLPLIVPPFLGNPLYIFLARQYYLSIPFDYDEAAKIDGAGHWAIFTRIMLPLTRPVWITMAILAFQASWNDYLNPLVYLYDSSKWPLSVGMASFAGQFAGVAATAWNQYMATNVLYLLPSLIIFFIAQRYFMQGLGALGTASLK